MIRYLFATLVSIAFFSACTTQAGKAPAGGGTAINEDSLAAHIRVLASDSFMGRKPFTEGETRTIRFLEQQFAALGLRPGNGDSYLQQVPMVNVSSRPDAEMQVTARSGSFRLKGYEDYVIWSEKTDPEIRIDKSELVFAGYGIVAPEYNRNDYAGLDVKGKIVLILVNDPGYQNKNGLFRGDTMTYYGRWTYKFEEAARQGAKGCLIIHNTEAASYPFSVVQNSWNNSRLRLDDRSRPNTYCDFVGWVSASTGKKLLQAAGEDSSLLRRAAAPDFRPFSLGVRLSTRIQNTATYNQSHNVIATLPGTEKPDEYIIYTAHWDHLGIGKADETGDSIYNGALDNASATAGLIELARAFTNANLQPKRSVVFLSVTAEEQGLWGSQWYAEHPVYPLQKTLANINMDGLNFFGKTKDIVVVGRGQSTLEDLLDSVAKANHREITYEKHPEAGYYYRSDHFNFAKPGVPALYTASGYVVEGKEEGYGKKMQEDYNKQRYHRPSDEFTEDWTLEGAVEDLKLFFGVGLAVANSAMWPQWKSGSEFKAIREQQLKN